MKDSNQFVSYKKFFLDLKKDQYFGRLGKVFKTNQNYYFIDTGTGKIASIKENVYLVLKCLFENDSFESLFGLEICENDLIAALAEIKMGVEIEKILSAPVVESMGNEISTDLEEMLSDHVMALTLEMTEECNLRCRYCIYHPAHPGYREFGKKHMTLETAKQAIDFLKKHSSKNDDFIAVGFYGGEPLLNFNVIKETISYAQETFKNQKLQFTMTTNGLLLTESISDYLVENNVSLTISLDGPKALHDENRIFSDDKGSFDDVMKGIKMLLQAFAKFNQTPIFSINMVNTGPDFMKRYDLIQDFFKECDWLTENIQIQCNGVDTGPEKMNYMLPQSEEERLFVADWMDPLAVWSDSKNQIGDENIFSANSERQELVKLHKRLLIKEPDGNYFMNGCCTPGHRRGYVDVNGNIFPCERVGNHIPPLGNVKTGWNLPNTKKVYVDDYVEKSKKVCKDCWAINLCGLCYHNCYDKKGLNTSYKNALCIKERMRLESTLVRYHSILENNPEAIQALNKLELV